MIIWNDKLKNKLKKLYDDGLSKKEICNQLKLTEGQARSALSRFGLNYKKDTYWTNEEIKKLKLAYKGKLYNNDINLDALSKEIGRSKANICRKAKSYNLTNNSRPAFPNAKYKRKRLSKEECAKISSQTILKYIKENGHPKGSLGMKHTAETKQKISLSLTERAKNMSEDQKSDMALKAQKTKLKKYGTTAPPRSGTTWKSSWRDIGGIKKYYRSKWEANYARYLEFLKINGNISFWEHEPETFWFEKIKRGTRSYLPDFKVTNNDGSIEYHEVKGWMDDRSKTKLSRMKKYYPEIKLILIDAKQYKLIEKQMSKIVPLWE